MSTQEGDVKYRSVCDACTAAKLRCNGKTPCERCLKKGIECHYQPFKNRGGHGEKHSKTKAGSGKTDSLPDTFLDEYEKRTWSVFFSLYKASGKGCSVYWFRQQLFRMLRFLERKAEVEATAANGLARLTSWMTAMGIDVNSPPTNCALQLPHFTLPKTNPATFQSSWDDLRKDAETRNLALLTIDRFAKVQVNEAFLRNFNIPEACLQIILDDAGGGFLPWGGDLLSRILSRETDLVLYIQSVNNTMDAIGKPVGIPSIQVIPTMNVLRARRFDGQDVLCIVRAVQQHFVEENNFASATMLVFELPDHPFTESSVEAMTAMPSNVPHSQNRARPYSETEGNSYSTHKEEPKRFEPFKKVSEPQDVMPLPEDILTDMSQDDEWLDGLLDWADQDPNSKREMSILPIADDIAELDLHQHAH